MKEMSYELLEDNQKKKLGKNNEANMTLYNAIPRKEAKVTAIEEAKDLATLVLDELIESLKLKSLGSKLVMIAIVKEEVTKTLMKKKPRHSTYWLGTSASSSERVRRRNRFGNNDNRFGKGRDNSFEHKGAWSDSEDGDEQPNDATCLMAVDSQEVVSKPSSSNIYLNITDLQKENEELLKFNKGFAKTFKKLINEKRSLEKENSILSGKINDFKMEVKKLANDKEVVEPCKTCYVLAKDVDSLICNVSKLQDEALNFSKFKESNIALDDMLSRQKLSQDKEGLGFSKNDKTTFAYDVGHVIFGSNLKGKVIGEAGIRGRERVGSVSEMGDGLCTVRCRESWVGDDIQ
uniref:Uncharacterized protein n=1 Tax=Tanacetum cinerariifolium TaxID=118510 RepID=A0A6L2J6A0_TANCI|nr:hypothetical protein [Tanacetum cinerariifolium]